MLKLQAKGEKSSEAKWYPYSDKVAKFAGSLNTGEVIEASIKDNTITFIVMEGKGGSSNAGSNGYKKNGYTSNKGGYAKDPAVQTSIVRQTVLKASCELVAGLEDVTVKNCLKVVDKVFDTLLAKVNTGSTQTAPDPVDDSPETDPEPEVETSVADEDDF